MTPASSFSIGLAVVALWTTSASAQIWTHNTVAAAQMPPVSVAARPRASHLAARDAAKTPKLTRRPVAPSLAKPVPSFDVPAKPEWSDDQGFRIDATRLAYKSRF